MLRLAVLALLSVASLACAGETKHSTIVDLDAVVAQGEVHPVNGMSSSGQPDEAALEVFAENGYVAVIDMRTAGEDRGIDEAAVVAGAGMEYVPFPIVTKSEITLEKAAELDELLARYDEPVLLHCGSGNRVGAMLALREYLDSGDVDKAMKVGEDAGLTRLHDRVTDAIEAAD